MSDIADVSIITANYNGARYLTAAIQSVLRQTLRSWELIIVDDASSDDSIARASEAAGGDPRIRIVRQTANRGPAAARNRALDVATGRWLAVFDSDDLMLPQRLEMLLRRASTERAAVITDNLLVFSESTRPRPFLKQRLSREASWIGIEQFIESDCLYSRTPPLGYLKPVMRSDIVRGLGLRYDESLRIGEDYNFLVRLMAKGHRLRLEPTSLYLYRKHESSVSHRLREPDIVAMLDAHDRFAQEAETRRLSPRAGRALKRRRRSLQSLIAYDAVIAGMKRGALVAAGGRALTHPHIWPLLTRPVTARIRRLTARLNPPDPAPMEPDNNALLPTALLSAPAGNAQGTAP